MPSQKRPGIVEHIVERVMPELRAPFPQVSEQVIREQALLSALELFAEKAGNREGFQQRPPVPPAFLADRHQ